MQYRHHQSEKARKATTQTRNAKRASHSLALVALTASVAIALTAPAFAEGSEWRVFQMIGLGNGDHHAAELTAMPFEEAATNFPGSAFYYLEEAPRLAFDVEELRKTDFTPGASLDGVATSEDAALVTTINPVFAAPSFTSAGTSLDKARALQCLSMAIYYEAANESQAGQQAVAQVVLNRVAHPAYPASVCGVVFQGSERRTGCQFSFTCDGSLTRKPARRTWAKSQSVALAALAGDVFDQVGTATHYHATYVDPYWAPSLDYIRTIGLHRFYRWKGKAGKPDAFSIAYSGDEPLAAPNRRAAAATVVPDDIGNGGAQSADMSGPTATGAASTQPIVAHQQPTPAANDALPQSGDVKEEFRNSGRWIREPGK